MRWKFCKTTIFIVASLEKGNKFLTLKLNKKKLTFFGGELGLKGFKSVSLFDLFDLSLKTGPSFSVKNGFFSKNSL
jgi:hypothetical protein